MKTPRLIVVHPVRYDDASHDVGAVPEAELRRMWLEVRALETMLQELGCERWESKDRDRVVDFKVQGNNWDGGMKGSVWDVPPEAVQAIHARFKELRAARESALAKLTDEECYALGVTRHRKERVDPDVYIDFLTDEDLVRNRKKKS